MSVIQGIGTFFAASASTPATEDASGYGAQTWTDVGELTDVPEYGPNHDVVTHTPISTGIKQKYHGATDNGSLALPVALDPDDAGQNIMRAALVSKDRISFRVTYADGTIDYVQGKVFSFTKGASVSGVVPSNTKIEFETDIVTVAA